MKTYYNQLIKNFPCILIMLFPLGMVVGPLIGEIIMGLLIIMFLSSILRNKDYDLFKINFPSNYFDCVISLHTIYHINKNKQEKAVRKLLKFVKKGKPVIIVYSNPNTIINKIKKFIGFKKKRNNNEIYFYTFSKNWWKRFEDEAEVKIKCWRSFAAQHQKILFPNNVFGKFALSILYKLENLFPKFFSKYFQYQTIILTKL